MALLSRSARIWLVLCLNALLFFVEVTVGTHLIYSDVVRGANRGSHRLCGRLASSHCGQLSHAGRRPQPCRRPHCHQGILANNLEFLRSQLIIRLN